MEEHVMDKKKTLVITINREYAAGGRSLAAILSEKLQIPYYDRDFVKRTVEESGFDEADVRREGEAMSRSSKLLDDFFNSTVSYNSSHDKIFEAEKKLIIKLAQSPCIIVGHCANSILDDAGIENISIYLHAPVKSRHARAEELNEYGRMDPDKYMEKCDMDRRIFYRQYAGGEISDASNYTFCFDTGKISIPLCADMVISVLQHEED